MKKEARRVYIVGVLAIVLPPAACGGEDGGGAADAGTMQVDSGRDGATPPSDAGSDTGTPEPVETVTCGSNTCRPIDILLDGDALSTLPACCMANDACGVEVKPAETYGVVVPQECTEPGAEGTADSECPSYNYEFPMLNTSTPFAGCCLPSGRCGVRADLSLLTLSAGFEQMYELVLEDFGCQETADWFTDAPEEPAACGAASSAEE